MVLPSMSVEVRQSLFKAVNKSGVNDFNYGDRLALSVKCTVRVSEQSIIIKTTLFNDGTDSENPGWSVTNTFGALTRIRFLCCLIVH